MSVRTEADERLESARKHVHAAIQDLARIVVDECHGFDGFEDGLTETMTDCMTSLMTIKHHLT